MLPRADEAGHDLNYIAYAGVLEQLASRDGAPILPNFQIADLLGGASSAVSEILAALWHVARGGNGRFVDVSMTHVTHANNFLAQVTPFGLPYRGRTSKLAWTPRVRRLTVVLGVLVLLVGLWSALLAALTSVLLTALVDVSLWIVRPVEKRMAAPFLEQARQKVSRVAPTVVAITGSVGSSVGGAAPVRRTEYPPPGRVPGTVGTTGGRGTPSPVSPPWPWRGRERPSRGRPGDPSGPLWPTAFVPALQIALRCHYPRLR